MSEITALTRIEGVRISKTINRDWKFSYFPASIEDFAPTRIDFNDEAWPAVAIPHTWSTFETTGELHPFIRNASEKDSDFWWYGWGWYRKRFVVEDCFQSKKIMLEFDGVQKYSKIWLNGEYIGEHKGGFTSFHFDVTHAVRFNQENVLTVEVSNRRNDNFGGIPPMTAGNWNLYGGIYRDVRLVIKDFLHIPFQGSADHEGGTFVTTPELTADSGKVRVRTFVKNDYEDTIPCTLQTAIVDSDNRAIATMEETKTIKPGELLEFDQTSEQIEHPKLWSPEHPYLYKVLTKLSLNGRTTDEFVSPLGFRWFDWNYEENCLYLNGKKAHIHGSNRHQEYPWLGDAIPKWLHEMDLKDIRFNLGFNFMRTCHYNQDPIVYDLTDQYGILICEEVPNIKNIEFGKDIQEQHVKEMIRRDRNHPSIIMWSMGNETNHAAEPRWAYQEDPTRILHCRHCAGVGEDLPHTHKQMPMESLLRCTIRGWYNGDVKPLEPSNHQHTGHEEWQHDQALSQGSDRPLAVNGSKWIYADHGCDREYFNSPLKHVNPKGWVDSYRMPKYFYYLWAANWSEKPVMFIHPYDWTSRYLGQQRNITVNSNCEEVVLTLNGTIIGRQVPAEGNDYTVVFEDVPVQSGTIRAEGMRKGELVFHELAMAGEPAKLVLTASHSRITADRAGVSLIKVDIVDLKGHHVYGATNELNFQITGPGKLVGPERYESDINKNGELEGTLYIDTPVTVPIRSTEQHGSITLTVSSPGLESDSITIESVQPDSDQVQGISEPSVNTHSVVNWITDTANESQKRHSSEAAQLAESIDDIDFRKMDERFYRESVNRWICDRNPHIDTDTNAYSALLDLMVAQLIKDQGLTVADDYNFNIQQFNCCSQILSFIQKSDRDTHIKQKLESYYVDSVIARGVQVDLSEQLNLLSSHRPWQTLGISLVEFGCCLAIGSFMPQTDSAQDDKLSAPEQIVKGIAQLLQNGYNFAELTVGALMKLSSDEFDELKQLVRDARITVPVFNSFIPKELKLTGPDVNVREIDKYVDQAMKRVSALGGRQIIFGSGGARSIPEGFPVDEAMSQIKQFLRLCEMYAGHYRITVAIEPLNRKESNILNTVGESIALAAELNLPHIKVLADAYHMNLEKEPFSVIARANELNLLSHVHISEFDRSFPLGAAGANGVDFLALFRELQQTGYDGAISAECSSTNFEENCLKSIGYVKGIWESAWQSGLIDFTPILT